MSLGFSHRGAKVRVLKPQHQQGPGPIWRRLLEPDGRARLLDQLQDVDEQVQLPPQPTNSASAKTYAPRTCLLARLTQAVLRATGHVPMRTDDAAAGGAGTRTLHHGAAPADDAATRAATYDREAAFDRWWSAVEALDATRRNDAATDPDAESLVTPSPHLGTISRDVYVAVVSRIAEVCTLGEVSAVRRCAKRRGGDVKQWGFEEIAAADWAADSGSRNAAAGLRRATFLEGTLVAVSRVWASTSCATPLELMHHDTAFLTTLLPVVFDLESVDLPAATTSPPKRAPKDALSAGNRIATRARPVGIVDAGRPPSRTGSAARRIQVTPTDPFGANSVDVKQHRFPQRVPSASRERKPPHATDDSHTVVPDSTAVRPAQQRHFATVPSHLAQLLDRADATAAQRPADASTTLSWGDGAHDVRPPVAASVTPELPAGPTGALVPHRASSTLVARRAQSPQLFTPDLGESDLHRSAHAAGHTGASRHYWSVNRRAVVSRPRFMPEADSPPRDGAARAVSVLQLGAPQRPSSRATRRRGQLAPLVASDAASDAPDTSEADAEASVNGFFCLVDAAMAQQHPVQIVLKPHTQRPKAGGALPMSPKLAIGDVFAACGAKQSPAATVSVRRGGRLIEGIATTSALRRAIADLCADEASYLARQFLTSSRRLPRGDSQIAGGGTLLGAPVASCHPLRAELHVAVHDGGAA